MRQLNGQFFHALLFLAPDKLTSPTRPKSKYADWEDPPQEGEPFDYDAVPNRFYFEIEAAGNIDPDGIIKEGIQGLQEKLASIMKGLGENDMDGQYDGPQSPGADMGGQAPWQDNGYTTPYGNGGNQSAWGGGGQTSYGGGGQTAYGTTPYGNSGGSGWS